MSYDIYKKLMACSNSTNWSMGNQNSIKKTNLYADKIGEESQGAFEGRYRDYRYIDDTLEALSLNYPIWTISLEEDNPFDGIGEDSDFGGDEDSGADTGGTDVMTQVLMMVEVSVVMIIHLVETLVAVTTVAIHSVVEETMISLVVAMMIVMTSSEEEMILTMEMENKRKKRSNSTEKRLSNRNMM